MIKKFVVLISALCAVSVLRAQPTLLDEGYRQMYNLEFSEAHRTFHEWELQHPSDPKGPVSEAAAYLFAEFDRLHILQAEFFVHEQHFVVEHKLTPDPGLKRNFDASLDAARRLCGPAPSAENAMFAAILVSGLRSDYLALIEKRYVASVREMKAGRLMAERLLAANPNYHDAWIAVGVENYMLSIKPAPVRWLLQLGGSEANRAIGLEKLRLTAEKGRYLAPFARMLLAVAALRDHDTERARAILAGLTREFPRNPLYAQELARLQPKTGARLYVPAPSGGIAAKGSLR